jgi:ABC-type lipoprotein export system ATPase subunit
VSAPPVVEATEVARTFGHGPASVVAVHEITCRLWAGDQVAMTGPSGSGKTTLLHLIGGLDQPTTGTISWPAIGAATALRPGPVAVVFQGPSLLPALDIEENVALPLLLQGLTRCDARDAAHQALARLALGALAGKLPEEISAGQAQRVAVARALAGRPVLILADEPTGQLDLANATLVVDALREVAGESGAALVLNTHDPGIAAQFDHHWSLAAGRLTDRTAAR